MKLSSAQIHRTETRIGAQAIPDDHPTAKELREMFGDHTFFLDDDGLEIVERAEATNAGASAKVVNLASWANEERTALIPHPPEVTDVAVDVEPEGTGSAGRQP